MARWLRLELVTCLCQPGPITAGRSGRAAIGRWSVFMQMIVVVAISRLLFAPFFLLFAIAIAKRAGAPYSSRKWSTWSTGSHPAQGVKDKRARQNVCGLLNPLVPRAQTDALVAAGRLLAVGREEAVCHYLDACR